MTPLPTDAELAGLCFAAYRDMPDYSVDGLQAIQRKVGDYDVIAIRGTDSPLDFLRDLAWRPVWSDDLGMCHGGVLVGALRLGSKLKYGGRPWIMTGHSLGGALAVGISAFLASRGKAPALLVTFGAPRFGMSKVPKLLAPVPVRQYRYGNDPVPDVPFFIWPLLRFSHARTPLIQIGKPNRDPLWCHQMSGYWKELQA